MKKAFALNVKGIEHEYTFIIHEDEEHLQKWREDGLQIDEVVAIIPEWWISSGHTAQEWIDRMN